MTLCQSLKTLRSKHPMTQNNQSTLVLVSSYQDEHDFRLHLPNGDSILIGVTEKDATEARMMVHDLALRLAIEYLEYKKLEPTVKYVTNPQ